MRASRPWNITAVVGLGLILSAAAPPDSQIADAAMRGNSAMVHELIKLGFDVNAAQGDGMTALHWAADRGDGGLTEMLIYAGADVKAFTRIGHYTPLHLASKAGSAQAVRSLIRAGSNVVVRTSTSGATPLHLAAASGEPEVLLMLLEHGADPNAQEGEWEQTPLTFAASLNRADAIKILLERGADPNLTSKVIELDQQQKLDQRARKRENEVLAAFAGAEERAPTPSQLQVAVEAGRQVYVDGLPEGEEEEEDLDDSRQLFLPPIDKVGGLTPLLHAVRQGHVAATLALLEGGADIDMVSASDGTSPLVMAAINGQFDLTLMLLEQGANPNIGTEINRVTPLFAIINSEWQPRTRFPQPQERALQQADYLEVMRSLLKAGADPNQRITRHPWYMVYSGCGNRNCGLVDTNGATAFWRAAYATDVEAMKLLVEYGAEADIPTKTPPKRQRLSPDEQLRRQARNALSDSSFANLPDSARLELLVDIRAELSDSAQVSFPDKVFENLTEEVQRELLLAAERADSVRALQPDPSGLPPAEIGGPGVYPLHASSGVGYGEGFAGNAHRHTPNGWIPAVKYLVEELGADVNARDHNGYTALHHAAARGDDSMILYLVEQGGDVTVVSRRGQTAADMANGPVSRISPFPATVALLESLGSINNHNCVTC